MNKLAIACFGLLLFVQSNDALAETAAATPEEAARAGLTQFQALLKVHPNPASIGVTKERAGALRLGTPLDVFMVYLTELQSFNGTNAIIHDTGSKFYPLLEGEEVVSSLYVRMTDKTHWSATKFGDPAGAIAISAVKGDYIIKVPALKVVFVATNSKEGTIVTPVASDGRFSFTAGQSLPLIEAMAKMKPYAMQIDPDKPG
jgi:hypothetical protein